MCSTILSWTVLLPWQHTRFQTSLILKTFLATFGVPIHICKWCLVHVIQQAHKYVSLSLAFFNVFELKITYILKSSGYGLKKSELPWEQFFFIAVVFVFCRTILPTKFQWSALQIGQESSIYILDITLGWVYDVICHLICLFYTFFKLKDLRN